MVPTAATAFELFKVFVCESGVHFLAFCQSCSLWNYATRKSCQTGMLSWQIHAFSQPYQKLSRLTTQLTAIAFVCLYSFWQTHMGKEARWAIYETAVSDIKDMRLLDFRRLLPGEAHI